MFWRKSKESVYYDIANKIVWLTLIFRTHFKEYDNDISARIWAEFIYFLLYIVDLNLFIKYENTKYIKRHMIIKDSIIGHIKEQYISRILIDSTPQEVIDHRNNKIDLDIPYRLRTYWDCKKWLRQKWSILPSQWTTIFALSLFIYNAIWKNTTEELESLINKEKLEETDLKCMPDMAESMERSMLIMKLLKEFKIKFYLKKIK